MSFYPTLYLCTLYVVVIQDVIQCSHCRLINSNERVADAIDDDVPLNLTEAGLSGAAASLLTLETRNEGLALIPIRNCFSKNEAQTWRTCGVNLYLEMLFHIIWLFLHSEKIERNLRICEESELKEEREQTSIPASEWSVMTSGLAPSSDPVWSKIWIEKTFSPTSVMTSIAQSPVP